MTDFLGWLAGRMQEPSTWAGLASLFLALHINVDPGILSTIGLLGTAIGASLAILIKERNPTVGN